jgi:hypothetical protein
MRFVAALLLLPLAGCFCTNEARWGLIVRVHDGSGTPINTATITVVDGDYTDTITYFDLGEPGAYYGAAEHEGTVHVTIAAPGFETVELDGVEIEQHHDACQHVITTSRDVEMVAI